MTAGENGDAQGNLLRAARVCHPDWENVGRLTFAPVRTAPVPWEAWKKEVFAPCLRPQLEAALAASATHDAAAWEACGRRLDEMLSPREAAASRHAGQLLAQSFTVPNGERFWKKMCTRVEAGSASGHLAVVLALRGAAFHLSPPVVLAGYILLEAQGAFGAEGMDLSFQMVDDCLSEGGGRCVLRAA